MEKYSDVVELGCFSYASALLDGAFWGENNFPQPSPISLLMSFHVGIIFGLYVPSEVVSILLSSYENFNLFWMIMFSYIKFQIHKKTSPLVFIYTAAKCTFKEETLLHCDYLNLLAIRSLIVWGSHFRTLISSLMWSGNIKIHLFMSSTKNLNLCYCWSNQISVYVGDEWSVCSCLCF